MLTALEIQLRRAKDLGLDQVDFTGIVGHSKDSVTALREALDVYERSTTIELENKRGRKAVCAAPDPSSTTSASEA